MYRRTILSDRRRSALRSACLTVTVLLAAAAAVALPNLEASAATISSTRHISGTYNHQDATRFFSPPALGGQYLLQSNFWNKAVAGPAIAGALRGSPVCQSGGFDLDWDPNSPAFSVTSNTANSYFADFTDPECGNNKYFASGPRKDQHMGCDGTDGDTDCNWAGYGYPWRNPNFPSPQPDGENGTTDPNGTTGTPAPWLPTVDPNAVPQGSPAQHVTELDSEFGNQIHAPASYPSLVVGCHWGNCSPGNGGPFPFQLSSLATMPVTWDMDTTHAAGGLWDASLDIWLDTNTRTGNPLPGSPQSVNFPGQNDGAEVMVWANNRGYGQNPLGKPITPTGRRLMMNVALPGVPGLWEVWGGRARSFDNGVRWNVVSFVNVTNLGAYGNDSFHTAAAAPNNGIDVKKFLDFATSLGAQCTTALPVAQQETTVCVQPNWWLTSVQAGFEIWALWPRVNGVDAPIDPNVSSTEYLSTNNFSVNPTGFTNDTNRIVSKPMRAGQYTAGDGSKHPFITRVPVLGDSANNILRAAGCPNGSNPSVWLNTARSDTLGADFATSEPMVESPAGSGNYVGTGPVVLGTDTRADGIGAAQFRVTCPNGTQLSTLGTVNVSDTADIMWINTVDGSLGSWQINPNVPTATVTSNPFLTAGCGSACQQAWKVVGSGDLNGDGRTDLLWFNASSGQLAEWLLNTTAPNSVDGSLLLSRTCSGCEAVGWRVVGVGDLNDDGIPDVLWHNVASGALSQWYLDGAGNVTLGPDLNTACPTSCSTSWKAIGLADVNDDGHVDIVWRDAADDLVTTWDLDGKGNLLDQLWPSVPCGCGNLIGLGDRNGDGQADLYWYDARSGVMTQQLVDGAGNVTDTVNIGGPCGTDNGCAPTWKPVAVNDFSPQNDFLPHDD
jgi:hypothetical protein